MLGTGDVDPPDLCDETEPVWSTELRGPYGSRARRLLEEQGEAAFLHLRKSWERLSEEDKKWLLAWGTSDYPAYSVELILSGLNSGSEALLLASLEAIHEMGR